MRFACLTLLALICGCAGTTQDAQPSRPLDWPTSDSTGWLERLVCQQGDGVVVMLSTGDIPTTRRYEQVKYVVQRNGSYWVGRRDGGPAAELPVRAWSPESLGCGR